MRKQQIAIIAFTLWLIILLGLMLSLQLITFEIFFVLGLIGLLVIAMFMEPKYVHPYYQRYIWYLIFGGAVIFAAILVLRVMLVFAQ
jgi:hypothetical protein